MSRILEKLADQHEERIINVLYRLENDVINEVTEAVGDLPTIYCDMDMVLCDFIGGTEEVLGVPFPKADKTERWPKISAKKDFWETLEWTPGAQRMWSFINK